MRIFHHYATMRKERVIIFAVVFVITIHVLTTTKTTDNVDNTGRRYSHHGGWFQGRVHKNVKKVKRINGNFKTIVWYDIHNNDHGLRNKAKKVDFSRCEYKECTRLPNHIVKEVSSGTKENSAVDADAVLFQGTHIERLQLPRRKNAEQVFVFAERESWMFYGVDTSFQSHKYENKFNWTMTYRMDSDIPMPYGKIRRYTNNEMNTLLKTKQKQREKDEKVYKRIFKQKENDVVWFVSNCASKSLREDYISELQKYITVDIIGECGDQSCPKQMRANCSATFEKKYKFILSFENTFHKDYVTEKLFDWFNKDIIQVVYGLANYSQIVPPGSIVNVADFETPKALAMYLKTVGTDRHKYISYLKQKDKFVALGQEEMQQRAYCRLCEMLHTKYRHKRVYENIGTWWQLNSTQGINPFVVKKVVMVGEMCRKSHNSTDKFVKVLKQQNLI